jgi:hypothetical protein
MYIYKLNINEYERTISKFEDNICLFVDIEAE